MKVVGATNACPIVITTDFVHCVPSTGSKTKVVTVKNVLGNTAANGQWVATYIDPFNFYLCSSDGKNSGAFIASSASQVICNIPVHLIVAAGTSGVLAGGMAVVSRVVTGSGGALAGGVASWSFTAGGISGSATSISGPASWTVTTASPHGLLTGDRVTFAGCVNTPSANGVTFTLTGVPTTTTFTVDGNGVGGGAEASATWTKL